MHPNRFCVAPMMDWTDRHCRVFHRACTRQAMLYTEMVTTGAVLRGNRNHILGFSAGEHPVALQVGGSDPEDLAEASRIGCDFGYDEINLNVGCPSDRVQSGRFGACLMAEPGLVARCTAAMIEASNKPVTVKCRIGIDDQDSESALSHFVEAVAASGVKLFTIHARKAWLQGLSPKENRDIPPLDYERVYRLKRQFPDLTIILNGGITTLEQARAHVQQVDGVMLGREAYHNPALLLDVDRTVFADANRSKTRLDVAAEMTGYINDHVARGGKAHQVLRHMMGLFHGRTGGRAYRRYLSENMHLPEADGTILTEAVQLVLDITEQAARHEKAPLPTS